MFSFLSAAHKQWRGGVHIVTSHKSLRGVLRSGRKETITMLARGPLQLSPCQQVDMQMEDRLSGIGTVVLHQAEAAF